MKDRYTNSDTFDEQLKKVAEEEHFDFEESAWDDLEASLNTLQKHPTIQFFKRKYLLLLGLLLTGTFVVVIWNLGSPEKDERLLIKKSNTSVNSPITSINDSGDQQSLKKPSDSAGQFYVNADQQIINSGTPSKELTTDIKSIATQSNDEFVQNRKRLSAQLASSVVKDTPIAFDDRSKQGVVEQSPSNSLSASHLSFKKEKIKPVKKLSPVSINESTNWQDLFVFSQPFIEQNLSEIDELNKKKLFKKIRPFFEINGGIQVAAANGISYDQNPRLFGAQIGGIYNGVLSVRIGFNSYNFGFTADSSQFIANNVFWDEIHPTATAGSINVTEVPFTVGLHFPKINGSNRLKFGLEASVVSSVLSTENYSFLYNNADPTLVPELEGKLVSKHLFNSYQIALNVQVRTFNFIDFGIKPFYNGNLKGIGLGQLKMNNYGAKIFMQITL